MDKISFRADKKSKFRKFSNNELPLTNKEPDLTVHQETKVKIDIHPSEKKKFYKNIKEIFSELENELMNRYNIDNVSVYQLEHKKENRIFFKNIYGLEISKYVMEKYFGYDCPVICTNAGGMVDNSSHRARLIEHINSYVIVVSSSAYEVYKNAYDISNIRQSIKTAFTEVEKLR